MGLARVLDRYGLAPGERATDASWRPLRYAAAPALLLCFLGVAAFALAIPPDPIWIAGLYDGADLDDAIALITDTPTAADSRSSVDCPASGGHWSVVSGSSSLPCAHPLLGSYLRSPPLGLLREPAPSVARGEVVALD